MKDIFEKIFDVLFWDHPWITWLIVLGVITGPIWIKWI